MYTRGFLPNKQGWLQQSNKFIEIVSFIDLEIERHHKEQEERNVRQQSRNNFNTR
jgi:hypothetical protein